MLQTWIIAARSLLQHKKRTFLLGAAIAGVTMLLVVMLGLFNGIQATVVESATTVMTGHVNVGGFYKVTAGNAAPAVTKYKDVLATLNKEVPGIDYIVTRGRGWAKVVSETGSMQIGVNGIDIQTERGLQRVLSTIEGDVSHLTERRTALLFEQQATKLGVKVGDQITIAAQSMRGVNNTIDVRVVAIAKNIGLLSAWSMFIPQVTLRELYQLNDETTGAIQVYLTDIGNVKVAEEKTRLALAAAGYELMDKDPRAYWFKFDGVNREAWTGQKLDISNWQDEISFIDFTLTAVQVLGNSLIFVLLVVIAVGIMNTLWIAIRERTREIGTLRAIGMQRGKVVRLFLTEAFLLSSIASILGALLGLVVCVVLNAADISVPTSVQLFLMRDHLVLAVVPLSVFKGLLLIVGCTTTIALIPSFLAARLKPITAMSSVG